MENQKPKTGKFALNYGLILGVLFIILTCALFAMDMHYKGGMSVLLVSLLLMLGVIIYALMQFKKANGGFLSFGEGLKVGMGLCLVGGIISILFNLILSNVIDPEMMTKQLEYGRMQMEEAGIAQEQIEAQIEMSEKFPGPGMQVTFGLIFIIFTGFVLSLIPTLIMKNEEIE